MRNDVNAAREQLEAAVRLRPDYVDAHKNLSTILMSEGKADEAIAHLEIAHRLRPDDEAVNQALREARSVEGTPR
jgi:Tfp pilus assembly protein PilF